MATKTNTATKPAPKNDDSRMVHMRTSAGLGRQGGFASIPAYKLAAMARVPQVVYGD